MGSLAPLRGEQRRFPISLGMARRQNPTPRERVSGHPIPAPEWFWTAVSKIRDSMTDTKLRAMIERQTGRAYSKFIVTRYFQAEKRTTTLEFTLDLWLTFGVEHNLPRPVYIAQTRAEAEQIAEAAPNVAPVAVARRGDPLDDSIAREEEAVEKVAAARHGAVLPSRGGAQVRGRAASLVDRGSALGRKRP